MLLGGVSSHGRVLLAVVSAVHMDLEKLSPGPVGHEVVSGDGSIGEASVPKLSLSKRMHKYQKCIGWRRKYIAARAKEDVH
jgi:hypothetical protein